MKRNLIGLLASLVAATALVAAQGTTPNQTKPPADVTLTGCLIQGSGPTVFILDNARVNAQDRSEKGLRYRLASAAEDVAFAQHVNHEVSVTGALVLKADAVPPPAGEKVNEQDLPQLSAKSLTMVSDKCTAVSR